MFRNLPATHRYWIENGQLRLTPADQVPEGARSWLYGDVTVDRDAWSAFIGDLRSEGLPDPVLWQLVQERGMEFWV